MFKTGEFVVHNNQVGVVAMTGEDLVSRLPGSGLEDHTGVWFGTLEDGAPDVWTIPTEYLAKGPQPVMKH
jgi:hypothetical protein